MAAVIADLHTRAASIFGKSHGGEVAWPYGLADPPRRNYRNDEDSLRYEEAVRDRHAAQEKITAWAERYGLKENELGCCPRWLQRGASARCRRLSTPCARYGGGRDDHCWMDHCSSWTHRGKPAVITAAPYSISPEAEQRLLWWIRQDARLNMTYGGRGWYGFGTQQIIMWRSDLITTVELA